MCIRDRYKGVADGEYLVGLSYEDPCAQLVKDGAPVKIDVYKRQPLQSAGLNTLRWNRLPQYSQPDTFCL